MQSIEAVISLMFFVMVISFMLNGISEKSGINDSLYKYQLAGDVWRVVSLKGHFQDFSFDDGNIQRDLVEKDLNEIYDLTGLCTHIGGFKATSCRGVSTTEIITVKRMLYVNGTLNQVTFSLALPKG
jgi:hypothetical protein